MRDLIAQERFEIEVLDRLNSARLLGGLAFTGGTMMRLCYGLSRFSVDLDFWTIKECDSAVFSKNMGDCLSGPYTVKDSADKHFTMLFEIKSASYPRSLKIEIRKQETKIATEQAIAYSRYASTQVLLTVVSLPEMMRSKIKAFLDRREIRELFDMEFLLKRGIPLDGPPDLLKKLLSGIDSLKRRDYTVKLGSLLDEDQRQYYISENFRILRQALIAKTGRQA